MLIIVSAIKVNIVRNAEVSLLVLYYPEGIGTYFISTILCNFLSKYQRIQFFTLRNINSLLALFLWNKACFQNRVTEHSANKTTKKYINIRSVRKYP